jgi:30S ribosomal protein S31
MGKGDRKSKKGKIWRASFGNTRPKPSKVRQETAAKKEKSAAGK